MHGRAATGRRLVVAVMVATIAMSVLVIATFNAVQGPDRLPQQIVRFLLTVALCVFLYRGAGWARWVATVLYGLTGLWSLALGFTRLAAAKPGIQMIAFGAIYAACASVLLFVPSVREHFERAAGPA